MADDGFAHLEGQPRPDRYVQAKSTWYSKTFPNTDGHRLPTFRPSLADRKPKYAAAWASWPAIT